MAGKIVRYLAALVAVVALLWAPTAAAGPSVPASSAVTGTTWCSALAAGDPVVDALGDSLTDGGSVADPGQHWTSLIRQALQSDGAPNAQVWTGGAIPGSATADYVAGAKYADHIEFTANRPDAILLGWGTNDWAASIPLATFRAQYQAILNRIHVLAPGALIVVEHMPWVYNPTLMATRSDQADYRDVIKDLAAANGAVYVGQEWPFRGDDLNKQNMPDGVHKNANGQVAQFATMYATLRAVCA
jgi:lysophospholipase L1-like esterase